jgi:MFS family permease
MSDTMPRDESPAVTTGRGRRKAAQALAFVGFVFWASLYLYVPLLPGHSRAVGAGAIWIGFITGSYGLAQLVLRIPMGMWSDHLGRRRPFVIAGCALAALSAAGLAIAETPFTLLVSRLVGGAAASTYLAFAVLYAGYFPEAPATAVTRLQAITNLGVVMAITIGPWISGAIGTRSVVWLAAGLGAIAVALSLTATTEPEPAGRSPRDPPAAVGTRESLLGLVRNRHLVHVSLLAAGFQYVLQGAWFVFVFDFAEREFGASSADLALLALFSGLPAAAAAWTGGKWLVPRVGSARVVVAGFALSAGSVALVPLVPGVMPLLLLQAVGGLARGLTFPVLMGMAMVSVPEERRAGAIGFFQATYSIGMTLGPIVTGAIGEAVGLSGGFWVMAVLAGTTGYMAARVLPRSAEFT